MNKEASLLLEFYQYLEKEQQEAIDLLLPYFKELEDREKAGMNGFGVGTPADSLLLTRLQSIEFIKNQLPLCENFEQLKELILQQRKSEEKVVSNVEVQLQMIDSWLSKSNDESVVTPNATKL